jgi:hypothetical protein
MSKFLNNRYCKLKGCNEMIPVERHGNSTYCCDFHTMVGNSTYNAEYYKKRVQNAKAVDSSEFALKRLAEVFGYEVPFDANMTIPLLFDWNITTKKVKRGTEIINVVGKYGYILFDNKSMKIYKI